MAATPAPDRPTIETAPARLGDEKWILLGGLAAIFAVGVGLLLRKPVPEVAERARSAATLAKGRKAQRAAQAKARARRSACAAGREESSRK